MTNWKIYKHYHNNMTQENIAEYWVSHVSGSLERGSPLSNLLRQP